MSFTCLKTCLNIQINITSKATWLGVMKFDYEAFSSSNEWMESRPFEESFLMNSKPGVEKRTFWTIKNYFLGEFGNFSSFSIPFITSHVLIYFVKTSCLITQVPRRPFIEKLFIYTFERWLQKKRDKRREMKINPNL